MWRFDHGPNSSEENHQKKKNRCEEKPRAAEKCSQARRPALVAARDRDERCARPQEGRVQPARSQENRGVAEAIRRAEQTAQDESLSLRAVDVDVLHQSGRREASGVAPQTPDTREG